MSISDAIFGDIFTLTADYIAWKHDGVPASSLLTLAIVFRVTLGLLK